jgi:hypothetical protein
MNPSTNGRLKRPAELAEGNAGEHASAVLYALSSRASNRRLRRKDKDNEVGKRLQTERTEAQ